MVNPGRFVRGSGARGKGAFDYEYLAGKGVLAKKPNRTGDCCRSIVPRRKSVFKTIEAAGSRRFNRRSVELSSICRTCPTWRMLIAMCTDDYLCLLNPSGSVSTIFASNAVCKATFGYSGPVFSFSADSTGHKRSMVHLWRKLSRTARRMISGT